jgi:hypothetical protein
MSFTKTMDLSEQVAQLRAENDRLRNALGRIATQDSVDLALDPDWARHIARATLSIQPETNASPPAGQPGAKPWPGHGGVARAPTNPPADQPGPLKAEHRFYPVGTHEEEDD